MIQYEVLANQIQKIEYNKQRNTITVTGNLRKTIDEKEEMEKELVVYCNKEANQVLSSLENRLGCNVIVSK